MNRKRNTTSRLKLIGPIVLMPIGFIAAYLGLMYLHFAQSIGISRSTESILKLMPALSVPALILIGFNKRYSYSIKEIMIVIATGVGWFALAILFMAPFYLNNFN